MLKMGALHAQDGSTPRRVQVLGRVRVAGREAGAGKFKGPSATSAYTSTLSPNYVYLTVSDLARASPPSHHPLVWGSVPIHKCTCLLSSSLASTRPTATLITRLHSLLI